MEAGDIQNLLEELRRAVRQSIESRYKTVDEFAISAGMKQSTVSRFLSGDRSSKLFTFLQIAAALDLDLGPLFPFGKPWNVADKKALIFSDAKRRRKKVTVLLSETSVIEIKRDARQDRPMLELKLS
jgi:transcriptional regulator with XRE-family HTH domain